MAHAVKVAGIEQGNPGVEGGVDGGDALLFVGGAVEVGHAHEAEAEGGDDGAVGAEGAGLHGVFPWGAWLFAVETIKPDLPGENHAHF